MKLLFALFSFFFLTAAAEQQTPPEKDGSFEACHHAYTHQKPEAPALCQPFADNDNREAMRLIGDMYFWGWNTIKQDHDQAVLWYKRAATKGETQAKYNLGVMYEQGQGVAIDYGRAVRWYHSAAKDGHPNAQFNVANMISKGAGVRQNDATAAEWYERAANQGVTEAQYNIANRYAKEVGVSQNLVAAYKWYSLAEKGGDLDASNNLQLLKKEMTAQEIAEAERLAAEFRIKLEWRGME